MMRVFGAIAALVVLASTAAAQAPTSVNTGAFRWTGPAADQPVAVAIPGFVWNGPAAGAPVAVAIPGFVWTGPAEGTPVAVALPGFVWSGPRESIGPVRAASGMARQTASVRLAPPLIVQPKPGVDPGDRLEIEIRGQTQASRKYEIEIEGRQGGWKRLYHRSLAADSGGVARFELTLSQLASSKIDMEWRLRTRGDSPQTPWSSWVPFRTGAPTHAKGRLKQPKTAPAAAPPGRLKLPKRSR